MPARRPAFPDVDKLEAAAAEIADDPVGIGDRRKHAFAGKPRFRPRAQHLAVEADAVDLTDEFGAVPGVADRGGREHAARA